MRKHWKQVGRSSEYRNITVIQSRSNNGQEYSSMRYGFEHYLIGPNPLFGNAIGNVVRARNMTLSLTFTVLLLCIGDASSTTAMDDSTQNGVNVGDPDEFGYPEVDFRSSASSSSPPGPKFVNTFRSPINSGKSWDRKLEINNKRTLLPATSIMPLSRYRKLYGVLLSANNSSRFHAKGDRHDWEPLTIFSRNFTDHHSVHTSNLGENLVMVDDRQALSSSLSSTSLSDGIGKKSIVSSTDADQQRLPIATTSISIADHLQRLHQKHQQRYLQQQQIIQNANKIFPSSPSVDEFSALSLSTISSLIPVSDKMQKQAGSFNKPLIPTKRIHSLQKFTSSPKSALRYISETDGTDNEIPPSRPFPPSRSFIQPLNSGVVIRSSSRAKEHIESIARPEHKEQAIHFVQSYSLEDARAEKADDISAKTDLSVKRRPYSYSTSSISRLSPVNKHPLSFVSHNPYPFSHQQQNSIVQYSRLAPAPPRPVSATSNNIVESIFAQSQLHGHERGRGLIDNAKTMIASGVPISNGIDAVASILGSNGISDGPGNLGSFSNELVNLVTAGARNGPPVGAVAVGTNLLDSVAQSAQSFLSSDSAIDTISKFARNLLTLPISNQEVFSLLASALSSAAKVGSIGSSAKSSLINNTIIDSQPTSNILNAQQLFHSLSLPSNSSSLSFPSLSSSSQSNGTDVDNWLKRMPEEQRSLLQAAIKSGELDLQSINSVIRNSSNIQSLSSLISSSASSSSSETLTPSESSSSSSSSSFLPSEPPKSPLSLENRLIEWIQQNRRHPPAQQSFIINASSPNSPSSSNTRQHNASGAHSNTNHHETTYLMTEAIPPTDKLPYYGRYCGSFSEPVDVKKQFGISGAVWAVDDHHFVISKFNFKPGALHTENVTFWAGPKQITGNVVDDMFPSANGFYLEPKPIDLSAFLSKRILIIQARIRDRHSENKDTTGHGDNETNTGGLFEYSGNRTTQINENDSVYVNNSKALVKPAISTLLSSSSTDQPKTINDDESATTALAVVTANQPTTLKTTKVLKIATDARASTSIINTTTAAKTETDSIRSSLSSNESLVQDELSPSESDSLLRISGHLSPSSVKNEAIVAQKLQPLGWYAAYQPLLLTLPDEKRLKTTYWIALLDHKRNQTVSSVLIPNGPAFKVPASIRLRPFTATNSLSSPSLNNLKYAVSSGPIEVLNMKTILINNLTLETNGLAVWFMVGKDLLPNADGHILPIYDRRMDKQQQMAFDCDSLDDYKNEDVTLRLPDPFDITDVFWLSIYSLPEALSLSHLYLPYNDMHLPPDLHAISTPRCVWQQSK